MKTYKEIKSELKETIKKAVENQIFTKSQRKTVKLVGDRKMPAYEAQYKVVNNREDLRILYAAYGVMSGKKYSEIENHYPEENHPLNKYNDKIEKLLVEYRKLEELVVL